VEGIGFLVGIEDEVGIRGGRGGLEAVSWYAGGGELGVWSVGSVVMLGSGGGVVGNGFDSSAIVAFAV
jgi:hypothetical protein